MNIEEFIVLRYLSDGTCHKESCKLLSEDLYRSTIKTLLKKTMVNTFEKEEDKKEGKKIVSYAQITSKGKETIRDRYHILETILHEYEITQDQFDIMQYAKKEGHVDNIFEGMKSSTFKKEVWLNIYKKNFLESITINGKKTLKLTRLGEEKLTEIEYKINKQISQSSEVSTNYEEDERIIEESAPNTKIKELTIANGKITAAICIVKMMCEDGYFVDKNDKKANVKDVMNIIGHIFNQKQFYNYSSPMNKACKGKKNTFLSPFYKLQELAEKFYNNKETRKIPYK